MASGIAGHGWVLLVMSACANVSQAPPPGTESTSDPSSGVAGAGGAAMSGGAGGTSPASGGESATVGGASGSSGTAAGGSGGVASAGSGGAVASNGGSSGSGTAGAPEDCAECAEPVGVTFNGATNMATQGGTGGSLYEDLCAQNEVVVGLTWEFGDHPTYPGNPRVLALRVVCAPLLVVQGTGYEIQTGSTHELTQRGVANLSGASKGSTIGAAHHVIVALGSRFGDAAVIAETTLGGTKEVSLESAALTIDSKGESYGIDIAAASALATIGSGQAGDTTYPVAACPIGRVARGVQIRSGAWIDAVGLICGVPVLTY